MTTVRDIMSFGALTIPADEVLGTVIDRLRRIGHEGYPVVQAGRVVGLLTARDMNRAATNNLQHLKVADVMIAGDVSITPDVRVRTLPATIMETGWGQIPVLENDVIIGIVTRTDVIRFYAEMEATTQQATVQVSYRAMQATLGPGATALVRFVGEQAAAEEHAIYMVGGAVRDLLLERQNLDLDFVLESAAIPFAKHLAATYGGKVETHDAFGTAKWIFDETAARHIGHPLGDLPPYIDLVTARHEFYEEPAVLPTVYSGGIKLDLRRRDFTINALAIQLNTGETGGTVIDLFGGLADLEQGKLRVLHSLSFADDPTRALRAIRFAYRLGFEIETRTASLIKTALPMLERITGERLKNEITLLLKEPTPAQAMLHLQDIGVLRAIHPQFQVSGVITERLGEPRTPPGISLDTDLGNWLRLATCLPADAIPSIGERLLLRKKSIQAMTDAARLTQQPADWLTPPPSVITSRLNGLSIEAIAVAWEILQGSKHHQPLDQYLQHWRHVTPIADGHTLKAMGVPPGPAYREILNRLRAAWLDGDIQTEAEEATYLAKLVSERE